MIKLSHRKLKILSFITWAAVILGQYLRFDTLKFLSEVPMLANEGFRLILDAVAAIGVVVMCNITLRMPNTSFHISERELSLISKWENHYYDG